MLPVERGAFDAPRDHWWWRDGWGPGIRYLTWHLTFGGADALHRAARRFAAAAEEVAHLDVVPEPWLHLTMTGVGFVGDLPDEVLDDLVSEVLDATGDVGAAALVFDRIHVYGEGIALSTDAAWLQRLKRRQEEAVARAGGVSPAPGEEFRPHVSLAYFGGAVDETALADAVTRADLEPIVVDAPTLALIELGRDDRVYTWRTIAERPLGQRSP